MKPAGKAMRRAGAAATLALGLALNALPAAAQQGAGMACPTLPPRTPMPREATPEYLEEPGWRARVAQLSSQLGGDLSRARVVFLGDSITQSWYPPIFEQFYGHRGALNLGIGGDFTQGLLWRLRDGGQWPASLRPQLAVLLIGTNNAAYGRAEDTALGVAEIVRTIRQRSPGTRILLVGLLPRGADASEPLRRVNQSVTEMIARCADNRSVFFADPGPMMVDGYGRLSDQIAYDRLHPTGLGYAILSAGLEPAIRSILGR